MAQATADRTQLRPMLKHMLEQRPAGEIVTVAANADLSQRKRRVLERRALATVDEARQVGVELDYLGIQELFGNPRHYAGEPNDWIIGPARRQGDLVVPRREQPIIRQLAAADIEFPLIYVAHEVPKEKTTDIVPANASTHTEIGLAEADQIVGAVPESHEAVELGTTLGQRTTQVMRGLRRAAIVGGAVAVGVATVPLVLAGAAASAVTLDPIVLGAMAASEPREGELAAWFVITRWDW